MEREGSFDPGGREAEHLLNTDAKTLHPEPISEQLPLPHPAWASSCAVTWNILAFLKGIFNPG